MTKLSVEKQLEKLELKKSWIEESEEEYDGKKLSYMEPERYITLLNKIVGFGQWNWTVGEPKFITSGDAISAGIQRSPSFSRFSSSTKINKRPCLASSITSSIVDKAPLKILPSWSETTILLTFLCVHQTGDISRNNIHFDIHKTPNMQKLK